MPRKSLRPHLNQIRTWVRQGRTDAWIAHQLDVGVREIDQFKRQNDLMSDEELAEGTAQADYEEEVDLRAEDDALIAAELEAAELEAEREREEAERRAAEERAESNGDDAEDEDAEEAGARARPRRRRGGRARRVLRRTRNVGPLEGTFDHGEEGYGLWLDPAVQDNPIYAEHWAGHRPIEVTIEEDQIVIRRAGDED
jgi:TATA-binding protein-associated factor Taf7